MELWLLRPKASLLASDNPWEVQRPFFMPSYGYVIRARTEKEAREMAQSIAGDERLWRLETYPWLDSHYTSVVRIKEHGKREVIIADRGAPIP